MSNEGFLKLIFKIDDRDTYFNKSIKTWTVSSQYPGASVLLPPPAPSNHCYCFLMCPFQFFHTHISRSMSNYFYFTPLLCFFTLNLASYIHCSVLSFFFFCYTTFFGHLSYHYVERFLNIFHSPTVFYFIDVL